MGEEPSAYKFYNFLNWFLVGNNENQIINTLKYYKFERGAEEKEFDKIQIPQIYEIENREKISIPVALPLANLMQDLGVKVNSSIEFIVNANAVTYLRNIADSYQNLKRGDLYKFTPGIDYFGLWFLPEEIMEGLKNYDWSPHQKQIRTWLLKREGILKNMEGKGFLLRPFKNRDN
ncbi:MAG: hypothetical protein Q8Q04_01595 [archaeon]|nr:hypothetical protein [archaeon]